MTQRKPQIEKELPKDHRKRLLKAVASFCQLLDRTPKPSTAEIRQAFAKTEMEWKVYCMKHNLGIRASMMFNAKIAYEWETRYVVRKRHQQQ